MTSAQSAGANGPLPDVPFVHRVVPATRRNDLRREIEAAHDAGLLSDLIFRSYARIFDCPLPDDCAGARSLIVGALPHPQSRVAFTWRGARFTALVPPSYIRYWQLTRQAEDTLNERLAPLGHWPASRASRRRRLPCTAGSPSTDATTSRMCRGSAASTGW